MHIISKALNKLEKTLGGLKFAVILISVTTVAMIIGTFVESYHGAEYAQRLIYKSPFFMILQLGFFMSVFFAACLRLPFKKRLYGFYNVHLGIMVIIAGSFITYHAGIDGNLVLPIKNPNRVVDLNRDVIQIDFPERKKSASLVLPFTAFPSNINQNFEEINVQTYLPFADDELQWIEEKYNPAFDSPAVHSSQYQLDNDFASETFTLSLHPKAHEFRPSTTLGPLTIHYLPQNLFPCFAQNPADGLVFYNQKTHTCFITSQLSHERGTTPDGRSFVILKRETHPLVFYPNSSPWPLDEAGNPLQQTGWRIFSKNLFKDSPHLFLFGTALSYFHDETWHSELIKKDQEAQLPWMGATLKLLAHETALYPRLVPVPARPVQNNNQLIAGTQRAVLINVLDETFWLKKNMPVTLRIDGEEVKLELSNEKMVLPFEFTLAEFKMDTDPGTRNPASYESFVNLFTIDGNTEHHIFMNNPLKYADFTFYQASYFQDANQNYGSVLSVNYDPGRFWKYLGSILLVLGSAWHFWINRKKTKA